MGKLAVYEKQMLASPDQQISLTDPDSHSMATSGRGSGVVGYNVQVAVDTGHHLIVAHEVTNTGSDRAQLSNIASRAKAVLGVEKLEAVADRGYYRCDRGLSPPRSPGSQNPTFLETVFARPRPKIGHGGAVIRFPPNSHSV
jgi:hypothetical protein